MKKYVSIDDIVNNDRYPFTKGQLSNHVTNRHSNGLATSIRKIGKRIYIREDLFEEWMESHVEEGITEPPPLDVKLEDLEFTPRTHNCLKGLNVKDLEDILNLTKIDLMKTRNMGKKSIEEIEEKVFSMGFNLKE